MAGYYVLALGPRGKGGGAGGRAGGGDIWGLTVYVHLKENLPKVSIIYPFHIVSSHNKSKNLISYDYYFD